MTPHATTQGRAALVRPAGERILAGVAGAAAEYFGIDVTVVRIAFVVLALVGGAGVPLYLAGWLLIPGEGSDRSVAARFLDSPRSDNGPSTGQDAKEHQP